MTCLMVRMMSRTIHGNLYANRKSENSWISLVLAVLQVVGFKKRVINTQGLKAGTEKQTTRDLFSKQAVLHQT